jgi:hypothetical protein
LDNLTLLEIEKMLELNNRSLHKFDTMPYPQDYVTADLGNRLIYDEHNYDVQILKAEFQELYKLLTGSKYYSFLISYNSLLITINFISIQFIRRLNTKRNYYSFSTTLHQMNRK